MENVFLIAPEPKKEEWKQFLDEKTGNRIKWVEDTENRHNGYCVIAMKSYIEKREETFREIEEKYSEQLKRAKQVFIFHLKTETSYVDHLEMIKGKKNWYYSVINIETGVPANSPHNKGVITDFKQKLLPGIQTSDGEGSEERHSLVRKRKKGLVMVGEKKEQKPSETSLEISQTSWEKFRLQLKPKDWNEKTIKDLLEKIKEECIGKSKTKIRIIVSGNIGSGKSSLINSFMSALSGKVWNAAGEGGRDNLLYSSCGVYFEHGPDLVCFEIRGSQTGGREEDDILKSIMEEKNEDTLYVILYLIDAATLPEEQGKKKEYQWVIDLKKKYNCFKYLVITHMDKKYPDLKNNIKAIMDNDVMGKFRDTLQRITDVPTEFIPPVDNSVDTTQTMTDPYRIYFLYLFLKFVKAAKEQKQKEKENKCIIM